jgi:hypothetical protein
MTTRRDGARRLAGGTLLFAAFLLALVFPAPTGPDHNGARAAVEAQIRERLPGWRVTTLNESWESAWTVVARCGTEEIGFQYIPEHGLPLGDVWTLPNNEASRLWLRRIADHWKYLIWRQNPEEPNSLSCQQAIAMRDREATQDEATQDDGRLD